MPRFSDILKSILFILVIAQIAPPIIKNIKDNWGTVLEPKTKVGVVTLKSALLDSTIHVNRLKKFFENKDIKAIVIKMDCPGGAAGASEALFSEIKAFKKEYTKPVVVWVQNMCASGGYYVACASDHIISTPSAFIGSIGAFIQLPQVKEFVEQFKVKFDIYPAGSYKSTFNPLTITTPEQQNLIQGLANDCYQGFVQAVAQNRPQLSLGSSSIWAEGKVFTGSQALKLGLVDELGSQSTVERYIREKALIEGEIDWVRPACPKGIWGMLMGSECDDDETDNSSYITAAVNAFCSNIEQKITPSVKF